MKLKRIRVRKCRIQVHYFYTSDSKNKSCGVCCGACPPCLLSIDELASNMDDKLFNCITSDKHHFLHQLIPPKRPDYGRSITQTTKSLTLTSESMLSELNLIHRMFYKDRYWMDSDPLFRRSSIPNICYSNL